MTSATLADTAAHGTHGTVKTAGKPGTHRAAIAALATSSFVFVTAETLPVGLLPEIATGLSTSEGNVGLLLATYAGLAAITTIPFTALTMGIARHRLLAGLLAVFAVSQMAAALAPNFALLTISRLVCALAHGVFWSTLTPAAARLVPAGQAGRAASLVFVGSTLALVLGMPLGTALGQWAGWRTAFAVLAVAGALSCAALVKLLPALPPVAVDGPTVLRSRLRDALAVTRNRQLMTVCGVTVTLAIAHFVAYTYVAPLVRASGGLVGLGLSLLLLAYGIAGLIGNLLVGRVVDRRPAPTAALPMLAIGLSLVTLAVGHGLWITVAAVLVWGISFAALPVALQAAVLRATPKAQDAGSAVYVVAFQIGIGGGSLLGNILVNGGRLGILPYLGAALAVIAAIAVVCARRSFPLQVPAPAAGLPTGL